MSPHQTERTRCVKWLSSGHNGPPGARWSASGGLGLGSQHQLHQPSLSSVRGFSWAAWHSVWPGPGPKQPACLPVPVSLPWDQRQSWDTARHSTFYAYLPVVLLRLPAGLLSSAPRSASVVFKTQTSFTWTQFLSLLYILSCTSLYLSCSFTWITSHTVIVVAPALTFARFNPCMHMPNTTRVCRCAPYTQLPHTSTHIVLMRPSSTHINSLLVRTLPTPHLVLLLCGVGDTVCLSSRHRVWAPH